jgi:dipeptidyl aminopeptidase/acylaminoacyl peptidase
VEDIRTPLLILHSDNDFRAPVSDAEQLFTALRRLRRRVQFVRYPREGHELSRSGEPKHRIDRLNRIVGWFDKYLKR